MINSKYMQLKARRWHPSRYFKQGPSLPQIDNEVYTFLDVRCPECMPTTSHAVNLDCHTCDGVGEVDLERARKFIYGTDKH
jgi:hypothetical protein